MSLVLQAEIDGKPLDEETVIDFCFFLLIAGLDNTNFTIRALLQQLAIDHELRQRLVDDPNLIDAAVEAAKPQLHSWQAARRRSGATPPGGLRSAAFETRRRHGSDLLGLRSRQG